MLAPNHPQCPRTQPEPSSICNSAQLDITCGYGQERCFGRTFRSIEARCLGGIWALVSTEACLTAPTFTKLGSGFCRTSNGGDGKFRAIRVRSIHECEGQCQLQQNCVGYEYQNNGRCEIHTTRVVSVKRSKGVVCYANDTNRGRRLSTEDSSESQEDSSQDDGQDDSQRRRQGYPKACDYLPNKEEIVAGTPCDIPYTIICPVGANRTVQCVNRVWVTEINTPTATPTAIPTTYSTYEESVSNWDEEEWSAPI